MSTIFARERRDVAEGEGRPRYSVVAAQGDGIKFFRTHVRKAELDAIAQTIGASVVILPEGKGEHGHKPSGGEHPHRRRRGSGGDAPSS